ncbi:hypothetical protein GIW70_26210 [Pseudomonas syringae]|nr:hypothetical protein [Pseudomonas syringae]
MLNVLASSLASQLPQVLCWLKSYSSSKLCFDHGVWAAIWKRRPLWRRVKQRIWGWVDRLVVNLLDRRG